MVAGERSGDLHAGNLIKSLLNKNSSLEIRGWGGDRMQKSGASISVHYRDLAFMGIWEVLKNLSTIRKLFDRCVQEIEAFQPDALVLVDYPGFNMRLAKKLYKHIPIYYYIAPKAWAWNEKRAIGLRKYVSEVFSILPFEISFFRKHKVNISYVGNPLLDEMKSYQFDEVFLDQFKNQEVIAVLPGSRTQEISHMVDMLRTIHSDYPDYHFLVAGVDNVDSQLYGSLTKLTNVTIAFDKTYEIIKLAKAAIVTSGTATLEVALFNVPQVVCYKTSALTYWIARMLLKIEFISLVNLIAGKEVVKELIQHDFSPEKVQAALDGLLTNKAERERVQTDYVEIKDEITEMSASETTAELLLKRLDLSGS